MRKGAPVLRQSSSAPTTWSTWPWVARTPPMRKSGWARPSTRAVSPPGSITSASPVAGSATSQVFSEKGPTTAWRTTSKAG